MVGGTRQTLRWLVAATAIAATVLLVAAPVAAKPGDPRDDSPSSTVYVTGPGIDVPIVVDGRAALRMLYLTSFRAFGQAEPDVPTARELGPRYEAWYFVTAADGRLHLITQDLFPCAASSVWAYTPTEQGPFARGFLPVPASTGWWHSTAMAGTVAGWGLPCSARAASALVAGGSGWGGPMATAWVLIGLAVVGVVRSSRRRSRGEPERIRS